MRAETQAQWCLLTGQPARADYRELTHLERLAFLEVLERRK